MGKLHTLRRLIKARPADWYFHDWLGTLHVKGAEKVHGVWRGHIFTPSYRAFVRSVLLEIGVPEQVKGRWK